MNETELTLRRELLQTRIELYKAQAQTLQIMHDQCVRELQAMDEERTMQQATEELPT